MSEQAAAASVKFHAGSIPAGVVNGKLPWEADVTGFVPGKHQVEFRVDANLGHLKPLWVEKTVPFRFGGDNVGVIDTTTLPNGTHRFGLVLRDIASGKNVANAYRDRLVKNGPVVDPPPVPVPPAPRSPWPHGGIGTWGPGADPPPGASRYDACIGAFWAISEFAALPDTTQAWVYTSGVSCDDRASNFFGMTAQEVQANGWQVGTSKSYPHSTVPKFGLPAYQQAWITNVIAELVNNKLQGIQIDDVDWHMADYIGPNAEWSDDLEWRDDLVSFVSAVYAALHPLGFYVLVNVSGDVDFNLRFKGHCDGIMHEDWNQDLAIPRAVLAAGMDSVPLVEQGALASARVKLESLGDGRALLLANCDDGHDPWGSWAT